MSKSQIVKGWFGSVKGTIYVEFTIPKNGIASGEKLGFNVTLDCTKTALGLKRLKIKLYEDTVLTDAPHYFVEKPNKRCKVMKCYYKGVEAGNKITYCDVLPIPKTQKERILESISGEYIKRTYLLMVVPVFNIMHGDRAMKMETLINLSSAPAKKSDPIPRVWNLPSQNPIPAPIQASIPAPIPPPIPPQYFAGMPQAPIPPQFDPYNMNPIPPQFEIMNGYQYENQPNNQRNQGMYQYGRASMNLENNGPYM